MTQFDHAPHDPPKNVIVVGTPRSGTSLTAAIFARQGYYVGEITADYLREGDDHNPFGYFEPDALLRANVELFRQVGHCALDTTCTHLPRPEALARLAELPPLPQHRALVASYAAHAPWVWKDPRFCYTLEYWWRLVDAERTRVVFVRRAVREIVLSYERMGWSTPGERTLVERGVAEHLRHAEQTIRTHQIPHATIDYRDYRDAPEQVAARLTELCGLRLGAADLHFRPDLNHSTWRGRLAGQLRRRLRGLPRGPVRRFERWMPRALVSLIFPERKYTDDHAAKSRASGR